MKIEHIDDVAARNAIDQIADYACIQKRWSNKRIAKNIAPLPYEKRERSYAKERQRPDGTLKHPPCAPAVFDICQIKETGYDGNRRLILEDPDGEFLYIGIDEHEIRDGRKGDEKSLHPRPVRSISLWHSMQVCTKGWLRRRGLRMS